MYLNSLPNLCEPATKVDTLQKLRDYMILDMKKKEHCRRYDGHPAALMPTPDEFAQDGLQVRFCSSLFACRETTTNRR